MRREIFELTELSIEYDVYPAALNYGVAIRRTGPHADELNRLFAEVWQTCYPGLPMEESRLER